MLENNIQTNVGGKGSRKKRRAQQREAKVMEKKKGEEKEEEMEKERKKMNEQEREILTVAFHKCIKNSNLMIEDEENCLELKVQKTEEDGRRDK